MKYNKYCFFLVLILLLSSSLAEGQEADKHFNKGVDEYAEGNFIAAVTSWEKLISSGQYSADLYYNLGNANFKAGSMPGAILYYEKALLLKPFNEDIRYNIEVARTYITDEFETVPELFFIKWIKMLSLILNSNQWALISLSLFIVSLVLVIFFLFSSLIRTKKISFIIGLVFLFISLGSIFLSYTNHVITVKRPHAIIFAPIVTGKSSPDDGGKDLFVIHDGTKVKVEDQIGEWIEVRLSDGNIGWIRMADARKI